MSSNLMVRYTVASPFSAQDAERLVRFRNQAMKEGFRNLGTGQPEVVKETNITKTTLLPESNRLTDMITLIHTPEEEARFFIEDPRFHNPTALFDPIPDNSPTTTVSLLKEKAVALREKSGFFNPLKRLIRQIPGFKGIETPELFEAAAAAAESMVRLAK